MREKNELHIIETKYKFNKLKHKDLYIWPLIRHKLYFEVFKSKTEFDARFRTRNKFLLLRNFFFGFSTLFRIKRFQYIFFNNADKRLLVKDQKRYDVFFDAWADKFGQDKSLFIEWAITKHFSKKESYSKNIISDLPFKTGIFLIKALTKSTKLDVNDLNKIKSALLTKTNINKLVNERLVEIKFYRLLFKLIRPKAVFLISGFTKETIVIAAHLQNIKVIEAQHGYIGHNHQFYNSTYYFAQLYYPDILLTFGDYEKKSLPNNFIYKAEQLLPIGSLYLEDIYANFNSSELENLTTNYKKVFCVTLQNVEEEKLINWVLKQAKQYPNFLFILKPRRVLTEYNRYTTIKNCILLPSFTVYEVLKYSDYNITIYSTTAIEAKVFDAKTLFYNINNLSVKYYDINDLYAALINEGDCMTQDHLKLGETNIKSYFVSNYYNNVKALKIIS